MMPRPPRSPARSVGRAVALAALLLTALPVAHAQDARALGMGGVRVAGPSAADVNPAFAAIPGGGASLTLPLGALSAVTRDYWDPTGPNFDALSTFDQASNLGLYLLDPAISPDQVTVSVDANGLSVAFQGGSPMRLAQPARLSEGLDLPLGGSLGPVHLAVRPFLHVHADLVPGTDTAQVFQGGSPSASATLRADAEAGVAIDVGTALALPVPAAALGGGQLYAGVQGSAVAGLARASLDLQGQAQAEQDSSGNYTGNVLYSYSGTTALGGLTNGTVGYGGEAALGLALTLPSPAGTITAGASVRHLGVMVWNLDETQLQADQSSSTSTPLGTVQEVLYARHVRVAANLALDVPSDVLSVPGMRLLVAADGDLDLSGGFASHLGAEARFGPIAARAGVGYQDGLRLGLGGGFDAGPVGIDVALTTHRSPFTDHQAFGVAASLAFGL